MPKAGPLVGVGYWLIAPEVVIRPILGGVDFGKPERAIRAGGDAVGLARGRRDRELDNRADGGDPANLVAGCLLRKPKRATIRAASVP